MVLDEVIVEVIDAKFLRVALSLTPLPVLEVTAIVAVIDVKFLALPPISLPQQVTLVNLRMVMSYEYSLERFAM